MSPPPPGIRIIDPCCSTNNKASKYRVFIFIFTLLAYSTFHLSRKPISVVKSVLHHNCTKAAEDEGTTVNKNNDTFCDWKPFDGSNYSELFGSLDLAYLFAYAVGMFISGHIAERVNLRYYLTTGMLLCGWTTAMFGLGYYWKIHAFYYYLLVQFFGGIVQASGWPIVVTCMGNWFGKGRRGFVMGVWNSHTSLGNILGSVIAGVFVSHAWGLSFIVPGAIIAGMGILVFFFLIPYPEDVGCEAPDGGHRTGLSTSLHSAAAFNPADESIQDRSQDVDITKSREEAAAVTLWGALKIPGVVEYSLCLFFAKLVSYTFLYWLPSYIHESGGFDPSEAADISVVFDLGGIIGGVMAGIISDKTGASAVTCTAMLVVAIPLLYLYYMFGAINLTYCMSLLAVMGIFVNGPYALITTAVSADLGTHSSLAGNSKALSTVTAIIDGTGSLGAALGPLLCGLIKPYGWHYVFLMLMVCALLAGLLLTRRFIKEIAPCCISRPPAYSILEQEEA